jgi:hypothetical protein
MVNVAATASVNALNVLTPPLAAAIVIVSLRGLVVMVTFAPATNVKVSLVESASTGVCPDTSIMLKVFTDPPVEAHVLSPLKNVVASLVPDVPNLNTGTVPDVS